MSLTLAEFNALPDDAAAERLGHCCGASRWVSMVLERRPFETIYHLLAAGNGVWQMLDTDDWREAFAHHPRLGERESAVPQGDIAADWSADEQSAVADASDATRRALAAINVEYERRFGFTYIISAAGKSAEELLAVAQSRLDHDVDVELRIAAEEQRRIMQLRLKKLITEQE